MSLRRAAPLRFSPAGLSDSIDETELFPGACSVLQNLIPDPSTKNIWTCRPAADKVENFSGLTTPGEISVFKVIGSLVYGLIASGLTPGYDEPFCYNIATNALVPITGVTAMNVPMTQPTTGDWTPPTMALCGVNLVVTHPGFDGVTNFFGWFDTSDPTAPVWHAGNTTGMIVFATVPSWVAQFAGRAWFGVNPVIGQPSAVFTDSLTLNVTNANQALTFYDNTPLTAAVGLPLNNQLGGVIQSLLVFKGVTNIYQVTGDYSTTNLAINTLNAATGTLSPRSIVETPNGIGFLANDGFRVIDFSAHVGDPIGVAGTGITVPFMSPLHPTRSCGACNSQVVRFTIQNSRVAGTPFQEYWYDLVRKVWSGPHTFPASMIDVYQGEFVVAAQGVPAALFLSKVVPDSTSGSTENGVPLSWVFLSCMLADNEQMAQSEATEMQVKTSAVATIPTINVALQDQNGAVYGAVAYSFNLSGAATWGSLIWGSGTWGAAKQALYPRRIDFSTPVVYNRVAVYVSGASAQGFQIGDIFIRRRILGYMQDPS